MRLFVLVSSSMIKSVVAGSDRFGHVTLGIDA